MSEPQKPDVAPNFRDIYATLIETAAATEERAEGRKQQLTMSVSNMPLRRFLQYVTSRLEISVICDASLDNLPVTVDVYQTEVGEVLSGIARRFNVDITEQGNLYYLGNLKAEDRGFLVRKVRRLQSADLEKVLSSLTSDLGRVFASTDGLVVVSDRARVLQRMALMLDDVERQPANTWIVQLYLISMSDSVNRQLGFDTTASLDISAAFASGGASKNVADGTFRAVLKAARESSEYAVMAEPMMLMIDGGESGIEDGERIPIPKMTVSDAGTVTTTGFEYVNTGITIKAGLREMTAKQASCTVSIDLTQVSGYVETSPITTGQTFTTTTILESGGTYLIGSMTKKTSNTSREGAFFNTSHKRGHVDGTIMIWARCYRIQGGYKSL